MGKREQEQCAYYRRELESSKTRLAELETRGIAAMSRYDVEIAHGGDGEGALRTALYLKRNHIKYFTNELTKCPEPAEQITLFDFTEHDSNPGG